MGNKKMLSVKLLAVDVVASIKSCFNFKTCLRSQTTHPVDIRFTKEDDCKEDLSILS